MSNNPTHKKAWKELEEFAKPLQKTHITTLFEENKNRFQDLSIKVDNLFFDYSKQCVTKDVISKLCSLLTASGFEQKRQSMFDGDIINNTEQRAVLHTALRRPNDATVMLDNENIIPQIHKTLEKMEKFSNDVRQGTHKGATGKTIKKIISIGIGGSDLGPRLVSDVLNTCANKDDNIITTEYVSNVDSNDLQNALKNSNAEETLFIVISKSFTTQETLTNALTARKWLQDNLPDNTDIAPHFVAVSSNVKAAQDFGLAEENIFPIGEWVNGRFSLWSAVGLPICLQHGFKKFRDLLDGAHNIDQHFLNTPLDQNIPVLMALIGVWNRNFLNSPHMAILPYAESLKYLPSYLQQLEMESNGKTIDYDGEPIKDYATCPILFGEIGTNGQHSFYQLLHQGSETIPCDFIGIIKDENDITLHHDLLLNNMLAQGQAMMQGQHNPEQPYRYFEGNKPSSTLLISEINPYTLGQMIALYEHKTFTQGIIWNLNSFDQFGVELGKELSKNIENQNLENTDPSTKGLYSFIHKS